MSTGHTTESQSAGRAEELEGPPLLNELLDSFRPPDQSSRERARELIQNLVDEVLKPGQVVAKGVTEAVNARIAAIDEMLSSQLNQILHASEFQKLEASWRGLKKLVQNTETGENMKIKVLNVSKKDLIRDFSAATEFTESKLWKAVYEYEFGVYGGDPFGALIGDYEFGRGAQDVSLLTHLSQVAAASHAPLISAAGAEMFGFESFTNLPEPRDLAKIFDKSNPDNTKWLSFRDSEESRFVALVVPHVLRRLPYGADNPVEDFDYQEDVSNDHKDYLWGNAAYEYAERLTSAFAKHHWCVAIRGPQGGGSVEDLPIHKFKSREGDVGAKCPTEILIPETRENELSELGFIALTHCKNTDYAAFFSGNSTQRPLKFDQADATASAKLGSQIPYLMASNRIAHYLKAMCRDKIGSFMSREECEIFLNRFVMRYVVDSDVADSEIKAKFPLRAAQITVTEDRAKPGVYKAVAHLRPHFQLDAIGVSLRLVAELPTPQGK